MASRIQDFGYLDKLLDVCVLLMQQARTIQDLHLVTEYQVRTINAYVTRLLRFGLATHRGKVRGGRLGKTWRHVYAWSVAFERGCAEARKSDNSMDRMLRVLRLIYASPSTLEELRAQTGYHNVALRQYLQRLTRGGMVYVLEWQRPPGRPPRARYAAQPAPFELQDAPRPSKGGARCRS